MDFRNFGATVEDGDVEWIASTVELDRFLALWDGSQIVGAAGAHSFDLTLPGGATVPLPGVAWVSVSATHRRQGLAGRLMAGLLEQAAERDEPVLGLLASEAGIYERFGYGCSTRIRVVEVDRRRARLADRWDPEPVELAMADDRIADLVALWDRYRQQRAGEFSRTETQFRSLTLERNKPIFAALHSDGYALYTVEPNWSDGHPAHRLQLRELVAVTPEAHLALWNLLLSVDLVGPIESFRAVPVGDPLPYLVTDPRAVRTRELNDGLWLRVSDPERCFGARTYRVDDRLTVGLVESIEDLADQVTPQTSISVGPDGCELTDDEPDLVACRSALGPLLLGNQASDLARGRRLRGSAEAVERATLLFGTATEPTCVTSF